MKKKFAFLLMGVIIIRRSIRLVLKLKNRLAIFLQLKILKKHVISFLS